MSAVEQRRIGPEEADTRLDRWFRRHFPQLGHGRLEKLLRTGQIRVDGKRARAGQRLAPGQTVRVPPLPPADAPPPEPARAPPGEHEAAALRAMVLHRDEALIVLNKPPGLAVQGGTRAGRHLDALLDALTFGAAERPRLAHRLDRDTSGLLVLARSAAAARALAAAFRGQGARKLYWAIVVGVPAIPVGRIDAPLAKADRGGGERVAPDDEDGRRAVTLYRVLDAVGRRAAWLALQPLTGRTHQLRVHALELGTPILGDGKYGGAGAFLPGAPLARRLHLHARRLALPHPSGGTLDLIAPPPPHLADSLHYLGLDGTIEGPDGFIDAGWGASA